MDRAAKAYKRRASSRPYALPHPFHQRAYRCDERPRPAGLRLGYANPHKRSYYAEHGEAFSNETALFQMSNGAMCASAEHREIGLPGGKFSGSTAHQGSF